MKRKARFPVSDEFYEIICEAKDMRTKVRMTAREKAVNRIIKKYKGCIVYVVLKVHGKCTENRI